MCTASDVARGNRGQPEEGEEEEGALVLRQETTMAPPLWPPPADVEGAEEVTEATQHDFQIEYLQISDDPAGPNASEEPDEEEEIASITLPPINSASSGPHGASNVPHGPSNGPHASNGQHAGSLVGAVVSDGRNPLERIVTVNGMQFHVYGNLSGLELLGSSPIREEDLDIPDVEEEEEEERRRLAMERAIEEANAADAARRAAPIPPDRRAMIVNAMKGINLEGFRPSWADSIPEDQWINKVKESSSTSAPP